MSITGMGIALALIFVSCQKEEINRKTKNESSKTFSSENTIEKQNGNLRVYYDNGDPNGTWPKDYGCKDSGGNCHATTDVSALSGMAEVIDTLVNYSDKQEDKRDVVKRNYNIMNSYFESSLLDQVIAGDYLLTTRGIADKRVYLIISDDENPIHVQPFIVKDSRAPLPKW